MWHGWRFPNEADDRRRVEERIQAVVQAAPDAVLVLRPSGLRADMVQRLRDSVRTVAAWFCDDPVLVKVQSDFVAPQYDITLHAGTDRVLELYETRLGVRGVSFPFWTDTTAFPRIYDPRKAEVDLVFIGNTHTRVKLWRYDWIASLDVTRRIVGQVADDPAEIHAGVAEDDESLSRAAVLGRLGLNISQRFTDYAGTRFDYPGLADMGEFPVPSRVVQLAALGVPVITAVGSSEAAAVWAKWFPPAICAGTAVEATERIRETAYDLAGLSALSDDTHDWFRRHYTAAARAQLLVDVLQDPQGWREGSRRDRCEAFLQTPFRGRVGKLVRWRGRTRRI